MTEPEPSPAAEPNLPVSNGPTEPGAVAIVGHGRWRRTAKGDWMRDVDVTGLTVRCTQWVSGKDSAKRRVFAPERRHGDRTFPIVVDSSRLDNL